MKLVKLTMVENETHTEGEDDTVTTNTVAAATYVNVEAIRSIHERKAQDPTLPRPAGTRIAFMNGSQFSVTESIEAVAALIAPTLN